jgi:hypothetical protein
VQPRKQKARSGCSGASLALRRRTFGYCSASGACFSVSRGSLEDGGVGRDVGDRLLGSFHLDGRDFPLGGGDRPLEIDHVDRLVVKGVEVPAHVLEVCHAGPLGDLVHLSAGRGVHHRAFGDVELVEDMEGRQHGVIGRLVRRRGLTVDRGADEARWRGEIAGKTEKPGAGAERAHLLVAELDGLDIVDREVDVVRKIGYVPIVGRRIGHDAERRVMHFQRAADRLDHERLARFVLQEEMGWRHDALRAAKTRRGRRHHDDALHRLLHLVDRGEVGERP